MSKTICAMALPDAEIAEASNVQNEIHLPIVQAVIEDERSGAKLDHAVDAVAAPVKTFSGIFRFELDFAHDANSNSSTRKPVFKSTM